MVRRFIKWLLCSPVAYDDTPDHPGCDPLLFSFDDRPGTEDIRDGAR